MLFMLAWIAADLRKALVLKQAATAGVRMHRIEDAPAFCVDVPALIDVFADDAAAQGGAGTVDFLDVARQRVRVPRRVMGRVAQQREEVADTEEAEVHHTRAFRLVSVAANSTSPWAFRGARSRSTIDGRPHSSGSMAKCTFPHKRS